MEIFSSCKNWNFHWKKNDIFLIFAQYIDCGYTLEPPRRGGSNEYPQSMFWSKNKKNRYTPANPSFSLLKWGSMGYTFHRHAYPKIFTYFVEHVYVPWTTRYYVIFIDIFLFSRKCVTYPTHLCQYLLFLTS